MEDAEVKEVTAICKPHLKPLIIPEWAMNAEIDTELAAKIAGSQNSHSEEEEDIESQEELEVGAHLLDQAVGADGKLQKRNEA